jgi:iron complex outermembrane receptor protein
MSKYFPTKFTHSPIASLVALTLGLSSTLVSAQQADEEKEKQGLETITVTAQKRAQNLQEVPVSVTAFSGDQMAESVIKDMYDLTTNTPGLGAFQSQSATNSSFSIRGVGTSSQNFGLESSVGLYVDGVYRARQNSMINNLVDVEAVEILRGPQGTLFGKNTPSGAILVRTKAPSHDGEDGFFEATVGNFGLLNYAGAASVSAIEDVLAFRVTAFGSQRDGIVSDVNLGDDKVNDRDRWGARLQALYTPTNDLSIRVIADYSKIDEICCAAPVQLSNAKVNPNGQVGSDLALPALGGTVFPGGDAFYDREIAVSFLPESSMTDRGLSAEINWDLDDNYSLVSISAYRKFESYDLIDADFTDVALFGTVNDSKQNSFSQELRIDYSSENVNYILGVYYFRQDLDLDYSLFTDSLFNPFVMAGFQGALDPLLGGIDALSAATGGLIAPSAQAAPAGTGFDHVANQEHESYAIFGQFDYKLTDELTITAGLRYTDESKDLSTVFSENMAGGAQYPTFFNSIQDPAKPTLEQPNPPPGPGPDSLVYQAGLAGYYLGLIGAGQLSPFDPTAQAAILPFQTAGWAYKPLGATTSDRPDINENLQDDQISGTLKLSYQPNNDTLIYASYGNGYKSGGTNTDRIKEGFEPLFDAETSQSFEIGLKKDFPEQDLRINGAIHYTTVSDFQANTFTGNGFNLQNAGDYKISGLELEATWLPMDTVEVNLGYARVNAEYDTFKKGNCWVAYSWHTGIDDPGRQNPSDQFCDRAGDRPGGEPEDYVVVKIKKDFEIGDVYAYAQVEYSYTGDIILDGSNDPYAVQEAYSVLNLRFFMNFTDLDMDVILWGRNVLNEEYINRTDFNTPLQAGKLNAYVTEPATYGVTLRKRF